MPMKRGKKSKRTPGSSSPSQLVDVCRLLNASWAKYLVIGAMAGNLHGLMRATNDIDLLIPKHVKNTEKILRALEGLVWGIATELDAEQVANTPFTIIGDTPRVDLLTVASRVTYADAAKTARRIKVDGVTIPYVDIDTLIKTKQTDRLQDQADIERLRRLKR
jgi:hypothetical protein